MFELSKLLLDNKIDRRAFVRRLAQAGISLAGASAIADNLIDVRIEKCFQSRDSNWYDFYSVAKRISRQS